MRDLMETQAMNKDSFSLRSRLPDGGTPALNYWGVDSETGKLLDVLVGPIDNFKAILPTNSMNKKMIRDGIRLDVEGARSQYQDVLDCYRDFGATIHITPPDPYLPLQIWARDGSYMTPRGMIIGQMAQWWRRGEYGPVMDFCAQQNIPIYEKVTAGCAEGGDFMMIRPDLAVMGYAGDRSQEEGALQVKDWLNKEGVEVFLYSFDSHFVHADVTIVMLTDNLAAAVTDVVDPALIAMLKSRGIRVIDVPYCKAMQLGCNVMSMGNDTVLLPKQNQFLVEACKAEGLKVYDPDVSCITVVGGGIHCMSLALRRERFGNGG